MMQPVSGIIEINISVPVCTGARVPEKISVDMVTLSFGPKKKNVG